MYKNKHIYFIDCYPRLLTYDESIITINRRYLKSTCSFAHHQLPTSHLWVLI